MTDLTERIDKELRQMAPHVRARKTAKLLEEALAELERLRKLKASVEYFVNQCQNNLATGISVADTDPAHESYVAYNKAIRWAADSLLDSLQEAAQAGE